MTIAKRFIPSILGDVKKKFVTKPSLLLLIGVVLGAISGCGQSGPLYLPDHPPAKTGPMIFKSAS